MSAEKVTRYRVLPYILVEDTGQTHPPGASEPTVLASAYDALLSRCAELEEALREARSNLRHAEHCNSNKPMAPPQGFRRAACDCGCDYARNVVTDALSANPLTSATGEK